MLDAGNDDHPVTIRHEWDSYFPSSGGKWKWQDREGTFYGFLSKRHIILMIFIHFNIKNSESPAFLLKFASLSKGISFPSLGRHIVLIMTCDSYIIYFLEPSPDLFGWSTYFKTIQRVKVTEAEKTMWYLFNYLHLQNMLVLLIYHIRIYKSLLNF